MTFKSFLSNFEFNLLPFWTLIISHNRHKACRPLPTRYKLGKLEILCQILLYLNTNLQLWKAKAWEVLEVDLRWRDNLVRIRVMMDNGQFATTNKWYTYSEMTSSSSPDLLHTVDACFHGPAYCFINSRGRRMMLSDIISWIQVQVIDIPRISVPQNKVSICQTIYKI